MRAMRKKWLKLMMMTYSRVHLHDSIFCILYISVCLHSDDDDDEDDDDYDVNIKSNKNFKKRGSFSKRQQHSKNLHSPPFHLPYQGSLQ